jgi:hypothetical protein
MFTRKTTRLFQTRLLHHTPIAFHQQQISQVFKSLPPSMNLELKKNILLNSVEEALDNQNSVNRMAMKDAHIPQHLPLSDKLEIAKYLRQKYYARPVLTSHPTEVLSEKARMTINRMIKNILSGGKSQKEQIQTDIEWVIHNSLLPAKNLTPEEEIDRQDTLYLDMMESWSSFNKKNIEEFAKNHQQKKEAVQEFLTRINKFSYSNVSSWAVADVDGNKKRTRKTMEHMESSLQLAIVERYMQHLAPLMTSYPSLESSYHYLQRCKQAITDNILFNLEGSETAKNKLIEQLTKVIHTPNIAPEDKKQLNQLKDLIDLVGFRGDLKQFVRQSSKSNKEAFNDMGILLAKTHVEFEELLNDKRYADLSPAQKAKFHHLLRTNSKFIRTLKEKQSQLSLDTIRELEILSFVLEYQDQFSYILSDTENYLSLNEVIILFGISAYFKGKLYVDDIRKPPVNLIPLCETPEDLENLPNILDEMLSNPYLKQVIVDKGEIVYVAGPSDLGKEGGLFAHINLIEAEKKAQDTLIAHQKKDSVLQDVQLRVLYGLGGDFHRRISQASYQLFATFQGSDGCKLGSFDAFESYVERVTGQASENSFRALELRLLEGARPQEYQTLKDMIEQCIRSYQKFTQNEASKALFRQLSIPHALGILTNTSSRGESKSSAPKDILKSRAIGLANYDISTLFMTRIFMSADGLVDLTESQKQQFISLYRYSTTVQELVQKILFAISVSQENRAWLQTVGYLPNQHKIQEWSKAFKTEDKPEAHHALAYAVIRLPKIIQSLSLFVLDNDKFHAFWNQAQAPHADALALQLIEYLAQDNPQYQALAKEIKFDLKPRYERLAKCIDDYHAHYELASEQEKRMLEENFVLALRGDKKITAGPKCIAQLRNRFEHLINPHQSLENHEIVRRLK